ncbi:MAG TPA: hypothetical protein VFZ65_12660 [Planctomycetota bacterium]|nr:hypothetical protein [Planctomycetota bacterium]
MTTGKPAHGEEHYGEPGAKHAPVALDPEHDIDARSAALWFVGGSVVVFLSLWLMLPIFIRVQQAEREHKIVGAPTTEYNDVKDAEMQFLHGENPTKKTIDQVLRDLTPK